MCPLFATPWIVARQASLSMGFSRREYWSGLPFPSPEDLPNPGIKPRSPALQADSLPAEPPGKPNWYLGHAQSSSSYRLRAKDFKVTSELKDYGCSASQLTIFVSLPRRKVGSVHKTDMHRCKCGRWDNDKLDFAVGLFKTVLKSWKRKHNSLLVQPPVSCKWSLFYHFAIKDNRITIYISWLMF